MLSINISADLSGLQRGLRAFGAKQVPFATALTLTRLAQGVSDQESDAVRETFDNPTPFTQKGFRVQPATKADQVAFVFAKDIAAQYLAPYVFGGPRWLGSKRAMLVPKGVATNQYGNLPRGKLQALKGKPGIFVGDVKTKGGKTIGGVWQRPVAAARPRGMRRGAIAQPRGGLKLLIRFEDTTQTRKHLPFYERAQAYVSRHARDEFTRALRQALATGRRR